MIKLYKFTNVYRGEIGTVDSEKVLQAENITDALYQEFQKYGCNITAPNCCLKIMKEDGFIPFDEKLISTNQDITVAYFCIIKLDNAAEYARENGIVYFFHTAEKSHLKYPHIHAEYSGEEIKISLNNFQVEGRFKSPQKQKEAVKYVKKNSEDMSREWHRIMESLGEQ